jgi:hypothetical protein
MDVLAVVAALVVAGGVAFALGVLHPWKRRGRRDCHQPGRPVARAVVVTLVVLPAPAPLGAGRTPPRARPVLRVLAGGRAAGAPATAPPAAAERRARRGGVHPPLRGRRHRRRSPRR